MTGQKGRSGGARQGAGRKAKMLRIGKVFRIKAGQTVLVHHFYFDGVGPGRLATVKLEGSSRNRQIVLEFEDEDGSGIRIGLYS